MRMSFRCFVFLILLSALSVCAADTTTTGCGTREWDDHPVLCHMFERSQKDPEGLASDLHDWAKRHGLLVNLLRNEEDALVEQEFRSLFARSSSLRQQQQQLPVVFAHGMGDSCFNSGMQHITQKASDMLKTYAVCVPTGDTQSEDTQNGYFLNMDASADVFAAKIQNDDKLSQGFHAIGFSQGNNVIRGYIAKYNTPPVHTFLSINGVNAGIGAVPYCRPDQTALSSSDTTDNNNNDILAFSMCDLLMEQASRSAYTTFAQEHSFQANYWRDPRPSASDLYKQYSQLAVWNNEASSPVNETLRENWAKTQAFVWVLATQDGMVWPREGEQWGAPDPQDPFRTILPREQTPWYTQDLFGLKTAEEAGKNHYESFEGDHLQFSEEDFDRWIYTYLKQ